MIINQNLNVNFHDIPHWIVAKIWMDKSLLVFLWFDIQSADIFFSLSLSLFVLQRTLLTTEHVTMIYKSGAFTIWYVSSKASSL